MASKPRIPTAAASVRRKASRRLHKPQECSHRRGASVSDKLEALKNLVPSDTALLKPDQLYQQTADYILLLKTQVFVLQKLVDFYGSQPQQTFNPNAV